jgi:hypothetical protein
MDTSDQIQMVMHNRGRRLVRFARILALFLVALATLWAAAALYFDLPLAPLRVPAAVIYLVLVLGMLIFFKARWLGIVLSLAAFVVVLAGWLSLKPSNDRNWQPDVAETAWAEIDGNQVIIHNLRNFEYRAEFNYTPHWETRAVDLSNLRGIDLFITYWGSPWIAHPIVSFDFGDQGRVALSIETRKEMGETYSAVRGFFRSYELIYTISDERDVVRLRTNFRHGEDVFLFHTRATPEQSRVIFLDYLARANRMRENPEWYNALTNNCTTNIVPYVADARKTKPRFDYRILLNGKSDLMMYERGELATDNLPLAQLKERAHINFAAVDADNAPDFSRRIRARRPGFTESSGQ